jgi:N-methylhydantoinase A
MKYKIGIDVGGTFTDFLLAYEDGNTQIYKVLSTPDDPSIGLITGLQQMADDRNISMQEFIRDVDTIVHGTTVTTNAVLTYRGARTGLLTTEGLKDTLEMRRGIREEQYNNRFTNAEPLVPRHLRHPIRERLDYQGGVITPIALEDINNAAKLFAEEGIEAIAICFMNSFANKDHEEVAAGIIREKIPGASLTVSSTLLPSIRFYDRISTTVLNSYVGPILRDYPTSLLRRLKGIGFQGVLLIMQSNGGIVSPEIAIEKAAVTLLSGPAGGPVAGITYTGIQGYKDCITVDMGGTSFDAALIKNQPPLVTTEGEINRLRLALPMLNIVTIGAGGGSISWIDEGELLRMGPQSAGAKPGPACYDLGGEWPTCTDADLLLGYLDKDYFAGGKLPSIAKKFHPERNRLYGYSLEEGGTPIEVINLRLTCTGLTEKPRFREGKYAGPDPSFAFKKKRKVYLPSKKRFRPVPVFDGDRLKYGNKIEGPAMIEQVNTTTFVSPEFSVLCDAYASFTMYLKSREKEFKKRVVK